ncbi:MAG: hypothetical protein AB7I59_28295 [Geminicoccaceae bacterium]
MRHRDGVLGRMTAALLLCVLLPPAAAMADALDDLQGRWAASAAGAPAMEWSGAGDQFSVSFTPTGGQAIRLDFAPSARPGVLAGRVKGGWSMGAMFGGGGPVDPLVEGTLYWARTAADAVYLYSLAVDDDGGFQLDRYRCAAQGDTLTVSLDRRTAEGGENSEQRLVRAGS